MQKLGQYYVLESHIVISRFSLIRCGRQKRIDEGEGRAHPDPFNMALHELGYFVRQLRLRDRLAKFSVVRCQDLGISLARRSTSQRQLWVAPSTFRSLPRETGKGKRM